MIPALSACTESPEPGHQHEHDRVGDREHADLALTRRRPSRGRRRPCPAASEMSSAWSVASASPPCVAARAHRADEDVGVEEVLGEPDPVAEQRSLGERARRVDRDDADRLLPRARLGSRAPRSASTCPTPGGPVTPTAYGPCRCPDRARARAPPRPDRRSRAARSHGRARACRRLRTPAASSLRAPASRLALTQARARGHGRSDAARRRAPRRGSSPPRRRRPSGHRARWSAGRRR